MPDKVSECRKCDRAWGLIGIGFGTVILVIGIDLLSGGALARLLTRGAQVAPVIPLRSADDRDAG